MVEHQVGYSSPVDTSKQSPCQRATLLEWGREYHRDFLFRRARLDVSVVVGDHKSAVLVGGGDVLLLPRF